MLSRSLATNTWSLTLKLSETEGGFFENIFFNEEIGHRNTKNTIKRRTVELTMPTKEKNRVHMRSTHFKTNGESRHVSKRINARTRIHFSLKRKKSKIETILMATSVCDCFSGLLAIIIKTRSK
jgi:hypothetical protein